MGQLLSEKLNDIHMELGKIRNTVGDIANMDYIEGLLTAGLLCVYTEMTSQIDVEIKKKGGIRVKSRGIGLDRIDKCFSCGSDTSGGFTPNISMFVDNKADGEKIISMFSDHSARLDYRPTEPDWIQVKVGACKECVDDLHLLDDLITKTPTITQENIELCEKY